MADVLQGAGGFLFLSADSNGILDQHLGRVTINDRVDTIYQAHLERALVAYAGRYIHIVVPNKETVARSLLPAEFIYEMYGPTPVKQYLHSKPLAHRITFFDPDVLKEYQKEHFFYRYDTHWTTRGALVYVRAALETLGAEEIANAIGKVELHVKEDMSIGDLGSKLGLPSERAEILSVARHDLSSYFTNDVANEGCIRHFTKDGAPLKKRALILHDSTAQWLVFILAEVFSELLMVHTPDMDIQFVETFRPDILIFMQMERFFIRAPTNNLQIAEFILEKQAAKKARHDAIAHLREKRYLPRVERS